ncbi:flavodoxin [Vibrio alfacsensis]|uniref:flavodoxin n=1 Tax=Vibrio alfacsensis TaxID=1074311 RepID=UPI0040676166
MNEQQLDSIKRKNAWLHDLVEVEFPTKESLEGREIYFRTLETLSHEIVEKSLLLTKDNVLDAEDIFLVDFHRLTVMFSILQSQRWDEQHDQEMIIEYLTQIILTPEFELYVGFQDGEPVGAAIVSHLEGNTLISDLAVSQNLDKQQFAADLAKKLDSDKKLCETIVLEN